MRLDNDFSFLTRCWAKLILLTIAMSRSVKGIPGFVYAGDVTSGTGRIENNYSFAIMPAKKVALSSKGQSCSDWVRRKELDCFLVENGWIMIAY